ncbi:MAG: two-component system response regulator, partial [Rhodothermaceae bacterium]
MYKPKILVVDDIPENIEALVTILEELETETEIISCTNGNDAVIEAMKHDFALMLLDVQMPGMDGFETLKYIRKEDKNKVVPALFLSAVYTSEVFQQKGVSSGAIDFIIKPINSEILLGKVKLFLEINDYKYKLVKRQ